MFFTSNQIFLQAGEDVSTEQDIYYGDREILETTFENKKLFINTKPVMLFRDLEKEKTCLSVVEPRFQIEKEYLRQKRRLCYQKLFNASQLRQLENLYLNWHIFLTNKHYVEIFEKTSRIIIPRHYVILDVSKTVDGYYFTCYNEAPVIAYENQSFGALVTKEDQRRLRFLGRKI